MNAARVALPHPILPLAEGRVEVVIHNLLANHQATPAKVAFPRAIHRSSKRHRPLICQPSGSDASAPTQACERAPSGAMG